MAPPLRPTPQTALPIVRQLGAELARWVHELGPLTAAPGLSETVERVLADTHDTAVDVEVLIEDATAHDQLDAFAPRIYPGLAGSDVVSAHAARERLTVEEPNSGVSCRIRVLAPASSQAQAAGTARASIVVAANATPPREFIDAVNACCDDRPLLIWVGELPTAHHASGWQVETLDAQSTGTVWDRLRQPPLRDLWGVLRADSALRALQSLAAVAEAALEQELRSLRVRRVMLQQQAARAQQRSQGGGNEQVGEVRTWIQRQFTEFLRGVDDRANAALAPLTGPVWLELDEGLRAIDDLEREPRLKTTALRLRPSDVDEWLEALQSRLSAHVRSDLVAVRDLFRLVEADIEQVVTGAGGPPFLARLQFLDDERLRRMLSTHLVVQRPYTGEIPRPGFFEYAMVARRYQMIAFMFISAFGLSFLRTYREFMLPSAVLLLSLGGLNVYISVRRERVETLDKELDRAREALRTETRRILTEAQRAWVSLLTQHLSDQVVAVVSQVESAVRAHQGRESSTLAQERQRIQRQLQAIEMAERKLAAAAKTRDNLAATLSQLRSELRPLVASPVKPPVARI